MTDRSVEEIEAELVTFREIVRDCSRRYEDAKAWLGFWEKQLSDTEEELARAKKPC